MALSSHHSGLDWGYRTIARRSSTCTAQIPSKPASPKHIQDYPTKGYDGMLEAGMTLCVESFIGTEGGREGVKLEEQVLITSEGPRCLSSYPLEESWL